MIRLRDALLCPYHDVLSRARRVRRLGAPPCRTPTSRMPAHILRARRAGLPARRVTFSILAVTPYPVGFFPGISYAMPTHPRLTSPVTNSYIPC